MENELQPQITRTGSKAFQPTTHVTNRAGEVIAWDTIQKAIESHEMTIKEAAVNFNLGQSTVRNRSLRHGWKHVSSNTLRRLRGAPDWALKAQDHREIAFDIAHESVKRFKPRAPRNFRELEAADKVARRAAGLDTTEVVQQTLIQVNETMDVDDVVVESVEVSTESDESALARLDSEAPSAP